jgi:hypothetical protein
VEGGGNRSTVRSQQGRTDPHSDAPARIHGNPDKQTRRGETRSLQSDASARGPWQQRFSGFPSRGDLDLKKLSAPCYQKFVKI